MKYLSSLRCSAVSKKQAWFKLQSKFADFCRKCKKAIAGGEWAWWRPGDGVRHPWCMTTMPAGERERLAQVSLRQMRGTPEPRPLPTKYDHLPSEIRDALNKSEGNVPKAAQLLKMSKEGLSRRLISEKKRARK